MLRSGPRALAADHRGREAEKVRSHLHGITWPHRVCRGHPGESEEQGTHPFEDSGTRYPLERTLCISPGASPSFRGIPTRAAVGPIKASLFGSIETTSDATREKWLARIASHHRCSRRSCKRSDRSVKLPFHRAYLL